MDDSDHPSDSEPLLALLAIASSRIEADPQADCSDLAGAYPELWLRLRDHFPGLAGLAPRDTTGAAQSSVAGYRLLRPLGWDAGAEVHLAQASDGQRVAFRLWRRSRSADFEQLRHAADRARRAAAVSHPGLVRVVAFGAVHGGHYHAQELLACPSLRQLLERQTSTDLPRRPSALEAARLVVRAARAVQRGHDAGVVHGDLRPGNLLLHPERGLLVADLGLAGFRQDRQQPDPDALRWEWPYRAPERLGGQGPAAPAEDVYALAAVLYEMLAGRPPVLADSVAELTRRAQQKSPVRPRELAADVPARLEAVVLRALSKSPRQRQRSPGELAVELGSALGGTGWPAGLRWLARWLRRQGH
jgi:serine/threonine protein kinase